MVVGNSKIMNNFNPHNFRTKVGVILNVKAISIQFRKLLVLTPTIVDVFDNATGHGRFNDYYNNNFHQQIVVNLSFSNTNKGFRIY